VGAPDSAALAAAEERVVDSLVGLGLLCGLDGDDVDGLGGLDDLDGLHGLAVLRFYFFSLPVTVAVSLSNFFMRAMSVGKRVTPRCTTGIRVCTIKKQGFPVF